jgi:uncharacterized membrane protein
MHKGEGPRYHRRTVTTNRRAVVRAALAIAAAMLVVRTWFIVHRAFDIDEFEHAHATWSVAQGLLPYRDFFEHHTPALYFAFAPLFARMHPERDADAAARLLLWCRAAMWLVTIGSIALTYRLASLWRDRATGAFATLLLATSAQFTDSMLEFRPDVPAVCALLVSCLCLVAVGRRRPRDARAIWLMCGSGIAFGIALMCTQKVLFAAPGLALVLAVRARDDARSIVAFAAGAALPVAGIASWFAAHEALGALYFGTVTTNLRLTADRFPPLPRLLTNIKNDPVFYGLGTAGIAAACRVRPRADQLPIIASAVSLVAGIFIIGKSYDQYYALLLPLVAVLAAAVAQDALPRTRATRSNAIVIVAMIALAAWSIGRLLHWFRPNDSQLTEIAWVTSHTDPSDTYLGGTSGPATFRPHAWYYFFLTGAFATDREFAALLASLESGAIRPRLVIVDERFSEVAPAGLLAYVREHYRHVRGDLYQRRQNEYGSEGLNTSEASDRFDRPLIK